MAEEKKVPENDMFKKGLEGLKKYKILIGFGLFVLITVFSFLAMKPDGFEVIYPSLSEGDRQQILVELSKLGIDYKISEVDGSVSVKSENVSWVRSEMRDIGLPNSTTIGFETIGSSSFGATQYDKKNQKLRETIVRLEKTLVRNYDIIEAATINAVFPEEKSLFEELNERGKASVLLKLRSGTRITPQQLSAVQYIVSSGIEGVLAEDVIVTDSERGLLNGLVEEDQTSSSYEKQLAIKNKTESSIASDISNSLMRTFGSEGVKVDVNVSINFDEVVRNTENFEDPGILRSRQGSSETTEKIDGKISIEPGVDGNGEVINYDIDDEDTSVLYKQEKEDIIENFEINKTVETVKQSPSLENVNVVVWVDEKVVQEKGIDVNNLIEPVGIAAGLTLNEDGVFTNGTVSIMPMFMEEIEEEVVEEIVVEKDELTEFIKNNWIWLLVGFSVLFVVIIVLIFLLLKKKKAKKKQLEESKNEEMRLQQQQQQPNGKNNEENVGATDEEISLMLEETPEQKRQREEIEKFRKGIDNQVRQLSNDYPKETAMYIKKLLSERR